MSNPEVLYWSSTGTTRRVAKEFDGKPLSEYQGGDYVLVIPTYGSPTNRYHAPASVKKFLKDHSDSLVGVIGVGNTNFGRDFCLLAEHIAETHGVPLITKVDLVLSSTNISSIKTFLRRCQ